MHTKLADRIVAAMLCSAIGDAMGGPVEGWTYAQIDQAYGVVDHLLPYTAPPDYHNHFRTAAGTVTDDTRLRHLIARNLSALVKFQHILNVGRIPTLADVGLHDLAPECEIGFGIAHGLAHIGIPRFGRETMGIFPEYRHGSRNRHPLALLGFFRFWRRCFGW